MEWKSSKFFLLFLLPAYALAEKYMGGVSKVYMEGV